MMTTQTNMDAISALNSSRLKLFNERLEKCSRHEHNNKCPPKKTKLPFFNKKLQRKQQIIHSNTKTPFVIANKQNSQEQHRTHLKRWQQSKESHRQHHNHHNYHEQYSDEHIKSTPMHFSKKFSFTQHSNHFSRFYMIFVIFLIYLLDKINCDQGECNPCIFNVEFIPHKDLARHSYRES